MNGGGKSFKIKKILKGYVWLTTTYPLPSTRKLAYTLKLLEAIVLEMTFLSARWKHSLWALPASLFHLQIVFLLVMIGASKFTCTRMLSRWGNLNSVLCVIRDCRARGIAGTSAVLAWETQTDETARRIIHNDLSPRKRRQLVGYVAILSFLPVTVKVRPRINDRCVWSMARVLERASKGFHLDLRALDSSNGAHYPSYIWKCIKLRSANCRKNWFPRPLYFRLYGLNPFSASTWII